MLFLPFQNVASKHQIASKFSKIFQGSNPPTPGNLGLHPPIPRRMERRKREGKERKGRVGKGGEREVMGRKGTRGIGGVWEVERERERKAWESEGREGNDKGRGEKGKKVEGRRCKKKR